MCACVCAWRLVQFGREVFSGSKVCVCFGVADGGLNEPLVWRRYCNTSTAGADHNNSPLTGEGEVKKKRKITGWGCDGERCWR